MITDEVTLRAALSELNQQLHSAIIAFNNKVDPSIQVEYIGTITGTDYLVPSQPVLHISSKASITINGQTTGVVVGDY